jgi:hypothetical protein
MTSPDCSPRLASLSAASEEASSCDAPTIYGIVETAQVPDFLRFTPFEVDAMLTGKAMSS